jgi:tetratricopeptide (TPR) repeat protein
VTVARQVLLLGLAGVDWSLLRPLLDSGRLPSLGRLLERSATGRLRSLQPQFEPLLWTSAATGRRADAHRVLDAEDPASAGVARPLSSLTRRAPALWHCLHEAGREVLLVNWPVTFPAEPVRGCCVSDLFFRLAGTPDGLEPPPRAAVSPPAQAPELLDLRLSPSALRPDELAFFAEPVDGDPLIPRLAVRVAEQVSVHGVTMHLLGRRSWPLVMVRYDLLNALGPDFMACHPPQLPWVPDRAFARYRDTMTHAAVYLDRQIGSLLQALPDDTGVVLFSERGLLADDQRPATAELAAQRGGLPWFGDHGVVALAGPGIARGAETQGAGLLDLAPTVLSWLGLPLPDGLEGRVLAEAFASDRRARVAGRPPPVPEHCGGHAPDRPLSDEESAWLRARWRETGVETRGRDAAAERVEHDRQFALAMVHIDAGRPARALPVLESLHRHLPDDDRVRLHLARCRQACGDLAGARDLLEAVVAHPQVRPLELMALARLYRAEGREDEALASLFRAEQAVGERPAVHCRIGEVYLQMGRLDEARRGFAKALERDPEHAESRVGLARLALAEGEIDAAVDHALQAVEHKRQLAGGHYWLARALVAAGRPEQAAAAYETLLSLSPGHVPGRRELADVLERLGRSDEAGAQRERLRRLETQERMTRSTRELMSRSPSA